MFGDVIHRFFGLREDGIAELALKDFGLDDLTHELGRWVILQQDVNGRKL